MTLTLFTLSIVLNISSSQHLITSTSDGISSDASIMFYVDSNKKFAVLTFYHMNLAIVISKYYDLVIRTGRLSAICWLGILRLFSLVNTVLFIIFSLQIVVWKTFVCSVKLLPSCPSPPYCHNNLLSALYLSKLTDRPLILSNVRSITSISAGLVSRYLVTRA